jgi:hypothetical protein
LAKKDKASDSDEEIESPKKTLKEVNNSTNKKS